MVRCILVFLAVVMHSVSETLIESPTSEEYFTKQSSNVWSCCCDLLVAAISSAQVGLERRWPPTENPDLHSDSAFIRVIAAMTIQNSRADKTSPCLTPFRMLTGLDIPRSVLIDAVELSYVDFRSLIHIYISQHSCLTVFLCLCILVTCYLRTLLP